MNILRLGQSCVSKKTATLTLCDELLQAWPLLPRKGHFTSTEACQIAQQGPVPAIRMKAGHEHRIPLTARAVKILKSLHRLPHNDHVFPGNAKDKPLSSMAMTMQLRRMKRGDITVHGFRSTFRDWASEQTSFPHETCEHALAHRISDKTEAAYRRGDQFEKRRKLMEA